MRIRRLALITGAALLTWSLPAGGSAAPIAPAAAAAAAVAPAVPVDDTATSHGSLILDGRTIAYTTKAGTLLITNADGEETARMFSVAYLAATLSPRTRPVTFVWNGGPGSSSMWLHLGSFGPVRLPVPSNAVPPAPGTALAPNPDSLLDATDLVFVDAVGTGYSRISAAGTPAMFFGVDQDAATFTQFIRSWLTKNDRWGSPVFLFGESYGTTRAANVVNLLQQGGVAVTGVVLVSSVLDFNALDNADNPGEDIQYIAFLPTEAAVARYHNAVADPGPDLPHFVDQVRAFAEGPYADALMRGDELDPATRRAIIARLHQYTGLDPGYLDRADLRIDPSRFEHELLHPEGTDTGRLDGRYTGPSLDRTGDSIEYDPTSDDALTDAFVTAFNSYVVSGLGYHTDQPYYGTNYQVVGENWNYRRRRHLSAPNVSDDLRAAMVKNPYLRVFSANGYYDLATPFFGTEYSLAHLDLPPALRSHLRFGFYPSGHMIYVNDEARHALRADLESFYRDAQGR